jgi:Na+/melibiose symporter-like transporter
MRTSACSSASRRSPASSSASARSSVTRRDDEETRSLGAIRGVATTGLVVIVAALVPVVLAGYDPSDGTLWFLSSLIFLVLSWAVILLAFRSPENRRLVTTQARERPYSSVFFWLALEIPVQLPLIVAVLGIVPDLGQALYATAVVFNLFQAAFILAQFVSAQVSR